MLEGGDLPEWMEEVCLVNKDVYYGEGPDEMDEAEQPRPHDVKHEHTQDSMTVAHSMYPVTIAEQVIREIRTQVNKEVCRN